MNKPKFSPLLLSFLGGILFLCSTSSIAGSGSENGGGNIVTPTFDQYRIAPERTVSFANAQELLKKEFAKDDSENISKEILNMEWYKVPNPVAVIGMDDVITIHSEGNSFQPKKVESDAKSAKKTNIQVILNSKKFDQLSPSSQSVMIIWHAVSGSSTNEQLLAEMQKFDRIVESHNFPQSVIDAKRISIIKQGLQSGGKKNAVIDSEQAAAKRPEYIEAPAAKNSPPSEKEESFEGHATLGE